MLLHFVLCLIFVFITRIWIINNFDIKFVNHSIKNVENYRSKIISNFKLKIF